MRAAARRLVASGREVENYGDQAAYVRVSRIDAPRPRRGRPWAWMAGTEMATKGKRDGLTVEILLRRADGTHWKPLDIDIVQDEHEIRLCVGGEVIYAARK